MVGTSFLLFGAQLTTWVTPVWLLAVGVALAVVVVAIVFGIATLAAPRLAALLRSTLTEGILLPLLYLGLLLTGFAAVGTLVVPARALFSSFGRLAAVGPRDERITVPPVSKEFEIPLNFNPDELQSFTLAADQPITVITKVSKGAGPEGAFKLAPGEGVSWHRGSSGEKPFATDISSWTAKNLGDSPANLDLHIVTDIEYPQVRIIPKTMLAAIGLVAFYVLMNLAFPKVAAIALTTAKESISQPLFNITLVLGGFWLLAFIYIPYYTFGEDVKMLKDSSLILIMLLSIIVAVWSASVSVADEIEGRTALTLLSKPVGRRQFIFGKFLGIIGPVVLMFILLGLLLLVTVSYKMVYDAREVSQQEPTWQTCYSEMIRTLPGLLLAFMEAVVLGAISVAISTRLPMLANLIVCASIYVLGHLVPLLVGSSAAGQTPTGTIVRFMGQFLATVLPVLDHFNIQAAVAAGAAVPGSYLLWALLYCVLYCSIAMLLALLLFEDRDLA